MNHYIYKISNPKTGEYYYGRRSTESHWKEDKYFGSSGVLKKLAGNKKPTQERLPEWKKEVLLLFDNLEELCIHEEIVIGDKWKEDPLCLNKVPGGDWGGGDASQMRTPEAKQKAIASRKDFYNTPEGKKFASDLGKRAKGKKKTISDDFRKAQRTRAKGRKTIHLGDEQKRVYPEELESYFAKGWKLGLPEWQKKQISDKLKRSKK